MIAITLHCQSCNAPCQPFSSVPSRGPKYCSSACANKRRPIVTPADRLRDDVDRSGRDDACWPWLGTMDKNGYGVLWAGGKRIGSHKAAWQVAHNATVPRGLVVRHLCPGGGVPLCCNPRHLDIGTPQQNRDDTVALGHHAWGERTNTAKLTSVQVREIRRLRGDGATLAELSKSFGVGIANVSSICHRRIWRRVS